MKDGLYVFENSRPYVVKASKLFGLKIYFQTYVLHLFYGYSHHECLALPRREAAYAVFFIKPVRSSRGGRYSVPRFNADIVGAGLCPDSEVVPAAER